MFKGSSIFETPDVSGCDISKVKDMNTTNVFDIIEAKNETIWQKVSDWFVYDIYYRIKDKYSDFINYLRNVKRFTKNGMLKQWHPYDSQYSIDMFACCIEETADYIEKYGNEEDASRNKKVKAMRELVKWLRFNVEEESGYDKNEDIELYIERYNSLYNKKYEAISHLLKGQDIKLFNASDYKNYYKWVEKFDGSGIEKWWD